MPRLIDDAVPMPGTVRQSTGATADLRNLKVGQSFHIPAADLARFKDTGHAAKAMQSTLFYPAKGLHIRVRVRPVDESDARGSGIRVWRIEDAE